MLDVVLKIVGKSFEKLLLKYFENACLFKGQPTASRNFLFFKQYNCLVKKHKRFYKMKVMHLHKGKL